MTNYWRMKDFSIVSVPYAYVDHSSYQADRLFVQNKVRMKFKGEYVKAESPYCIVFCKVRKVKRYVTIDKRSKKAQKEYYSKQRGTWGELNPVTRSVPSGKTYNRNRDKQKNRKIYY